MSGTAKNKTSELYQQALLVHHKSPYGYERAGIFNYHAEGENAVCGDEINININIEHQHISLIGFSGDSCAICRASASIMCHQIEQLSIEEAQTLVELVNQHFTEQALFEHDLTPLNSVFSLPIRQQCALLPWQTLSKIISSINNKTNSSDI